MLQIEYYLHKYHITNIYQDYQYLNNSTINKYDEEYYDLPPNPNKYIGKPTYIRTPFMCSPSDTELMLPKWLINVDRWYLNDDTIDKYDEEYYDC